MRVAIIDPANLVVPYVDYLASSLAETGNEVSLWASTFNYHPRRPALSSDVALFTHFYRRTTHIGTRGLITKAMKSIEHVFDIHRLKTSLQRWKPDIIHYQQSPIPIVDSYFIPRLSTIVPLIVTLHNLVSLHSSNRFTSLRYHQFLSSFDAIVTHTTGGNIFASETGFGTHSIHRIRPGCYVHYKKMIPKETINTTGNWRPGLVRVLMFGNLRGYKGIESGLQAFAKLSPSVRAKALLTVVGRGTPSQVRSLKRLANHLRISPQIEFTTSYVEDELVHSYFAQSDFVLAPHREVDLSGVLMTAMAEGKPVIASRVGSFAEYLTNGVHGILVPPDDIDQLATALNSFIQNPASITKMGAAMVALASSWPTWDMVARQHTVAYQATITKQTI